MALRFSSSVIGAVRAVDREAGERLAERGVPVREVAVDGLQAGDHGQHRVVVVVREHGRGGARPDPGTPRRRRPRSRRPSGRWSRRPSGQRPRRPRAGRRSRSRTTGSGQKTLPMNFLPSILPRSSSYCLMKVTRPGAADADHDTVDVLRDLRDERRVVGLAQRRPDAGRDVAAEGAELGHEAGERRVRERVVVTDDRGRPPAERVVRVVAETGRPLGAIRVEAEEVRRLHLQGRVLGARGAVDERDLGMLQRVVRDRDALVARQRADEDLGAELLDQAPSLLDRLVGRVVGAAVAHDLDRAAGDGRTVEAVAGLALGGRAASGSAPAARRRCRPRRRTRTRPRSRTGWRS